MDCSVQPLKHKGLSLISTTDYFYPSVDDPYMQGRIGAANVLSDLYAMGVIHCDNILMILAVSRDMDKLQREVVTKLMIEGFNDAAKEAETEVTGGQTVMNPWPIIGGAATSVCTDDEFIMPRNAVPGDLIVLTKPLGTQVAVNVGQWRFQPNNWPKVEGVITMEEAARAYYVAMVSMARLNRNGARLMHKYGAHAATDVTGFGIVGHGRNLAGNQKRALHFEIHTLPIIRSMKEVDKVNSFKLMQGFSAETSGGLFVCLPADKAEEYCKELETIDKYPAWIIGKVIESLEDQSKNTCNIIENPTVLIV